MGYLQKFATWLSGSIVEFIGKITGKQFVKTDSFLSKSAKLNISAWLEKLGELSLEENMHVGITSKEKINEIRRLHDVSEELKQYLVGPDPVSVPPGAMLLIKEGFTMSKKLMDEVHRCKGLGNKRVDPYYISLVGIPGTGKSAVMEKLANDILDHRGYAEVDRMYARSTGDQYWSGYNHQPVVMYDDLGALIPKADISDLGEIIRLKSNAPVPLPMAAVEEKGKMFMSDFLLSSSNIKLLDNHTDIRTPDAFYRRRNCLVEVTRGARMNPQDVTEGLRFWLLDRYTANPVADRAGMNYEEFKAFLLADIDVYMAAQSELLKIKVEEAAPQEEELRTVPDEMAAELRNRVHFAEEEAGHYQGVAEMDGDVVSFDEILEKYKDMNVTGKVLSGILEGSFSGFYVEALAQCSDVDFESHVRALCESDPMRSLNTLGSCCWRLMECVNASKRNFFVACGLAPQYANGVNFKVVDDFKYQKASPAQLFGLLVQVLNQVKKTGEVCPLAQYIHQVEMRQTELLQEMEVFEDAKEYCEDFPSLDGLERFPGYKKLNWSATGQVYPDMMRTCNGLVLKDHEEFIVVSSNSVVPNDALAAMTRQNLMFGRRTRVAKDFCRYIPLDDLYCFKSAIEGFGFMDAKGVYSLEQIEILKDMKQAYGETGLYALFLLMVFENTNIHLQRQKRADSLVEKRMILTKKVANYRLMEKSWLEKMSWPMKIALAVGAGFAALGTAIGLGASLWGMWQWAFGLGKARRPQLVQEPWFEREEEYDFVDDDIPVQREQNFGSGDEKTEHKKNLKRKALIKNTRYNNAISQMEAESEMKDGHWYMTMQLTLLALRGGATKEELKEMMLDELPDELLEELEVQTAMPYEKVKLKYPQSLDCLFTGTEKIEGENAIYRSALGSVAVPKSVATIMETLPLLDSGDDGFVDNGEIRMDVAKIVKEGFQGPLKRVTRTRPAVVRELKVDKQADDIAKVLVKAGAQVYFEKIRTRAQVVRVFGGVILLPIHYLMALDDGDEFYLVTTQNVTKVRFEQSNLILLNKNQDLVLYDCGPRVPIARDIRKFFYKYEDLAHYVSGPGFLMNVCMSTRGPTVFQEYLRDIQLVSHARFPSGTYYDTGFGDHSMLNAVQYPVFSKSGYCGSMILRTNPAQERKILGIHVASNKSCVTGFAEVVCQEDLDRAFEMLDKMGKRPVCSGKADFEDFLIGHESVEETETFIEHSVEYEMKPMTYDHNLGRVQQMGTVRKALTPVVTKKTDIVPSPIHAIIGEPQTEPSVLHNRDKRLPAHLRGRWDPALDSLCKYGQECTPFPLRKIQNVEHFLIDKLSKLDNSLRRRAVTSEQEAIDGVETHDFRLPIDMDTSPGYPYILKRGVAQKGKRFLFSENPTLESGRRSYSVQDSLLRTYLDDRLEAAKQGRVVRTVTMESLKDERRKTSKIRANPATRTFTCLPLDLNLLIRRYFQDFGVMVMEHRHKLFCKVGINPDSLEWTQMFYQWKGVSPKGFAGDYAKFDGIGPPEIYESIIRVVNAWYGDSHEDQVVRRTLLMELFHRDTMIDGEMYRIDQGLPSGFPQTVIFNSFVNYYFLAMAWVDIFEKSDYGDAHATLEEFDRLTTVATYGDDNVVVVCEEALPIYNLKTVGGWLAEHGITYTDDKKTPLELAQPFVSIYDVSFLKRTFKQMDNKGLLLAAPLDKIAIEEQLHWIRQCQDEEEALYQNACNAVYEGLAHGKEYYHNLRGRVDAALNLIMFDFEKRPIPTYRQHMMRWWLSKIPFSSPLSIAEAVNKGALDYDCNLGVACRTYSNIDPILSTLETYREQNPARLVLSLS